jgi:hypothetical protein
VTANSPIFPQIFRGAGGGKRIAVIISAYFDESSEQRSKDGIFAVCGYALDDTGVRRLSRAWARMNAKYGVPYFRMSECNYGSDKFEHLGPDERDLCARRAIALAHKFPLVGYAYVLDQPEYKRILQDGGFDCDPYSFLVWTAFIHVNKWVQKNKPDHIVNLYFENGHESEPRARELLSAVKNDKFQGLPNRVGLTGFVKKEVSEPAQAGDLLAWQVRRGYEHIKHNKKLRKDTLALIEGKSIKTIEFTPKILESLRDQFIEISGSLERASRNLFSEIGAAAVDQVKR